VWQCLHRRSAGIERIGAAVIIAELGVEMSAFPTPQHAAAWAGVCPGNNEGAGKRKAQPGRKGNVHLTTALVQAAMGAARKSGTYLKEKSWRLKARRGPQRAALAIAGSAGRTGRDVGNRPDSHRPDVVVPTETTHGFSPWRE
jgi:transposase